MTISDVPNIDDVYACLQCGYCKGVCPVASVKGWESFSPRGKVYWFKRLANRSFADKIFGKKIQLNREFMNRLFACTLCGRCEAVCHVEIDFVNFWLEARKWLVVNGYGPPAPAIEMSKNIFDKHYHNPFKEKADKRDEWYKDSYEFPKEAEILYWPGCVTSYYEYKLLLNNLKILKAANVDFTMLGNDEMCCGAINPMMGNLRKYNKIVNRNSKKIMSTGARMVVTNCPGCFGALRGYKKRNKGFSTEVRHISELFWDLIQNGDLKFTRTFKEKFLPIVYHDPCELGRHAKIFDPPRNILKSVPGIEDKLMEFPTFREHAACCGGGGGLKAVNYELSSNIGLEKIDSAIDLGARTIVTACPNCKIHLSVNIQTKVEEARKEGRKLKMNAMDISDVLVKVL